MTSIFIDPELGDTDAIHEAATRYVQQVRDAGATKAVVVGYGIGFPIAGSIAKQGVEVELIYPQQQVDWKK